jgi:inhibitor of KinA
MIEQDRKWQYTVSSYSAVMVMPIFNVVVGLNILVRSIGFHQERPKSESRRPSLVFKEGMTMDYTMFPLSEYAVTIRFSTEVDEAVNDYVHRVAIFLEQQKKDGIFDIVPTFSSVTVYYDPLAVGSYEKMCEWLRTELERVQQVEAPPSRTVVIPVCYGGEFGPDLEEVARFHGMTEDEVIAIHAQGRYRVYMIGFAPGFAYLGGLSPKIATPRRATPRTLVPAGSVGIAGNQTGVYPLATPGGWQIIGRTPLALFRPHHEEPSLLRAGDIVQFCPITEEQYRMWDDERHSSNT